MALSHLYALDMPLLANEMDRSKMSSDENPMESSGTSESDSSQEEQQEESSPAEEEESLSSASTLRSGTPRSPLKSKTIEDSEENTNDPPPEGDQNDANIRPDLKMILKSQMIYSVRLKNR